MRIALFTETYLPYLNGVVTHVKMLKEGLEKLGHQVLVVCANPNTKKYFIKDGVLNCPAKTYKKMYGYGLASPFSYRRRQILKNFRPDIIHIHNEFGVGYSGVRMARRHKIPLVYTLHTMYDQYLYYIAPKPFIKLVKKISHKYAKYLAKSATALTGPSKKVEAFFKDCGVNKSVSVIENPVELDAYLPSNIDFNKVQGIKKQYGIKETDTVACFCGRMGKEKNVDTLIKYWASKVKPDDNLKLLLIGGGPNESEFRELAEQLKVSDTVIFTGRIEHDEMPPYYGCADIYLTASVTEMHSIAMLEAMATGQAVVHLYDELNESQLTEGLNGFVYKNQDEMYDILIKIRNMTKEQKMDLKSKVTDSVKQADCVDLANEMLEIYDQIIKEKYKEFC